MPDGIKEIPGLDAAALSAVLGNLTQRGKSADEDFSFITSNRLGRKADTLVEQYLDDAALRRALTLRSNQGIMDFENSKLDQDMLKHRETLGAGVHKDSRMITPEFGELVGLPQNPNQNASLQNASVEGALQKPGLDRMEQQNKWDDNTAAMMNALTELSKNGGRGVDGQPLTAREGFNRDTQTTMDPLLSVGALSAALGRETSTITNERSGKEPVITVDANGRKTVKMENYKSVEQNRSQQPITSGKPGIQNGNSNDTDNTLTNDQILREVRAQLGPSAQVVEDNGKLVAVDENGKKYIIGKQ
jgi:hypothetical protein